MPKADDYVDVSAVITHKPDCHAGSALPCPAQTTLYSEVVGEHWWSGWPGAYCMKCGSEDPQEICLADDCRCECHADNAAL